MASSNEHFVVGIGASAGGVEALQELFRHMPADTGMAFVVVAHLAPGQESALPEIVGRATSLPVRRAEDGAALEGDRVYVAGPDTVLSVEGGRLRVHATALGGRHHERNPVDVFLSSLAEDRGERAIAVILSGTGTDGTLGLAAVKERGGLAVAQGGADGAAPRHNGMPSSAIATGLVDIVVPVELIGAKLADYVRSFGALAVLTGDGDGGDGDGAAGQTADEQRAAGVRRAVHTLLHDQVGHDFSGYKKKTFMRRVQRRMQVLQATDVDGYVERLGRDPAEVRLLFRDLLIGVTSFFRDRESFEALEREVVPRLFEGKAAPGDRLRVWVPACSTGEEAYSIAILLRERAEALRVAPKIQVFATDIDEAALEVARAGRYPAALVAPMAPERLRRFFTLDGGTYAVCKQVRDSCVFSSHSIVRDPPFSSIGLVSCRNLLIYLDAELQGRVVPTFHYALRPGGYLFLGNSESISRHADLFAPLDKKHRLYQRRDHVGTPVRLPAFLPGLRSLGALAAHGGSGGGGRSGGATGGHNGPPASTSVLRRAVEARVLERFAPAHVVVNGEGDVVYYSPRTGKYLEAPAGQPSRQLSLLARRGLRLDLRDALQHAVDTRQAVRRERVAVELDEQRVVQLVNLTVEPLPEQGADPLFLVLFEDAGPALPQGEATQARLAGVGGEGVTVERVERELRDTRERLQSTAEEYETALEELKSANEELVSVNEELQSTNEELETSKEEIQAVNEELNTVNQELNAKVDQLHISNNDLRNLFKSTQIAIIFLDRQSLIRSFTPAAAEVFNLIPADRGRPLADIAGQLDHPGLHEDIRAVLAGEGPVERRVARREGRVHYLMRALPYLDRDQTADGAVLTLVDITSMVAAERQQQTLVHELNHRVRNMLTVVSAIASQTLAWTPEPDRFAPAFLGRVEALARAYGLVSRESWGDVPLEEVLREELEPHALDGDDGNGRLVTSGPKVLLRPRAALALGLVLHELATNAAKYGALSVGTGQVRVTWNIDDGEAAGRRLLVRWRETGGPPVRKPGKKGFGSELIERQVDYELEGEVEVEFAPGGLEATLAIPLTRELLELPPGV